MEVVLAQLIEEMNKPEYVSDAQGLNKLSDPKWQRKMQLAQIIQDLAKEDFGGDTSAPGWEPDDSFNKIKAWWKDRKTKKGAEKGTPSDKAVP